MSNVRRTLQMTSLLFGMVVLFCYIGWHLGYDGLLLVGEIDLSLYFRYFICKVLLFINLTITGSFVLQDYTKKAIIFTLPIVLLSSVFDALGLESIGSGPAQMIYFIVLMFVIDRKKVKGAISRSIIVNLTSIAYQVIAIIFKTGDFTLKSDLSFYEGLMFSIDMIILLLLIWSIGGVQNGRKLEHLVFPGRIRDEKLRNKSGKLDSQDTSDIPEQLDKFEQWIMRSVIGVVQILQWIFILWVCSLDNLFIDALVMTTSFICHGMIINKRKHLKPIILCTLVATMMFYFAARFTISFQYSQFFPIVIGLLLVYTIYRISCSAFSNW